MRELFRRLMGRPLLSLELVGASLFANLLALAAPIYVIQVLNRYVANGVDSTLMTLSMGAIIAVFIEFSFRQVRHSLAKGISIKPDEQIAKISFGALTRIKSGALDKMPPGQQRQVLQGVDHIRNAYSASNISTILDLPFAVLFLAVLYLLSPELGVIASIFIIISFIIGLILTTAIRTPSRALSDAALRANIITSTAIQESDTVRVFNAADALTQSWQSKFKLAQTLFRKIINRQGLLASLSNSIVGLLSISTIGVGAILVVQGKLDVGALIGANILAARALQPITKFSQMGETFLKANQSLSRLNEFLKLPREAETGSAKRDYSGSLELRDLSFMYPETTGPLFESLSVIIPAGSICVISGKNGSGKTSLSRMIVGLIEPDRGQILADGLDLRQVHPEWWRKQIIYLPQEPGFINGTFQDNLTINNTNIDLAQLNEILNMTGLKEFLDETPDGLLTNVIDNGRKLAVGIRRRLALARGLVTGGKLMVLDEPTEGMDKEGSQVISMILTNLHKQGHTVIMTSHDPKIINQANIYINLNSKPIPKITASNKILEGKTNEK